MYILFSGFRGTYRPPALPSDGLEDNVPDVHDEADFDIRELGVLYPSLRAMINREDLHLRVSVRFRFYKYTFQLQCICCIYTIHIQCIYNVYTV